MKLLRKRIPYSTPEEAIEDARTRKYSPLFERTKSLPHDIPLSDETLTIACFDSNLKFMYFCVENISMDFPNKYFIFKVLLELSLTPTSLSRKF